MNIYTDPLFTDPGNTELPQWGYDLTWDFDAYSSCIDRGDPELEDPDETRSDIGAFYYPQETVTYPFDELVNASNIVWLSFPVMDTRYDEEEDAFLNEVVPMLHPYTLFDPPATEPELINIDWMIGGHDGTAVWNDQQNVWTNGEHRLTSPYGYKLRFRDNEVTDLEITGRPGLPDKDVVPLYSEEDEERTYLNWIGYFVPKGLYVLDAFSTNIEYMYSIKTQRWSIVRRTQDPESEWIIPPSSDPYTIHYMDCIEVKVFADSPSGMLWNVPEGAAPEYYPPETEYFSYVEEMDYTPVYIVTEPGSPPSEIATFVDSVCIGAAVVEDTLTLVRAYLPDLNRDNNWELAIAVHYGDRGAGAEPVSDYHVFDPATGSYIKRTIDLREGADYYMISLKGPDPDAPARPTGIEGVWPNPFNPTTTVRFNLAGECDAQLKVYNVRGQLVKTLLAEQLPAGLHEIMWHGVDENERPVASGVYFVRLAAGGREETRKMLLLK
ncbi:MAG: T9SS type A sorting domain-containing protein [Candidatus Cloacimonetes bacterium]|nr:T9SS type A sorting domain-containing protein [Candidatus Cloacimonadota bacterium]